MFYDTILVSWISGYYHLNETSLYYCNSRYYNPEWGRWLDADDVSYLDPSSVNGLNLYAYCGNNPVMVGAGTKEIDQTYVISAVGGNAVIGRTDGTSSSTDRTRLIGSMFSGLSAVYSAVDKVSSYLTGSIDGLLNYADISKFNGFQSKLNKYSNWLMGIGIGLNIASSAYNNYNNSNLTAGQKWASFGADVGCISVTSALSYLGGSIVTKGSVALGTAIGTSLLGTSIGGVTIGFVGAISIGAVVVIVGIIVGTILITVVSNALDNWWDRKKEEWFY